LHYLAKAGVILDQARIFGEVEKDLIYNPHFLKRITFHLLALGQELADGAGMIL
jgi:hypothetical protein